MAGTLDILSFKDWCRINRSVPFNKKQSLYNEYLKAYTQEVVTSGNTEQVDEVKEYYKAFLSRLIVFYKDDPEVRLLNNINMDDNDELVSAIPLFAKKIKELSDIFKSRKKSLVRKKEFYSSKGSKVGLSHALNQLEGKVVCFDCKEKYNITC